MTKKYMVTLTKEERRSLRALISSGNRDRHPVDLDRTEQGNSHVAGGRKRLVARIAAGDGDVNGGADDRAARDGPA